MRLEGEAVTRCPNTSCPARLSESLQHFGSKEALDIDGLGEKLAEQLVDTGLVKRPADLFALTVDDVKGLERMGEKSARNLLNAIADSQDASLARVIYALGIPHVGRATADLLAAEFGSLDVLRGANRDELERLEAIGPKMASGICEWCEADANQALVAALQSHGIDPELERRSDELRRLAIVLTGQLESMTREEAEEAIRLRGGKAASSVSGNTDYLVVGDDPGATKTSNAEQNDVKTIGERRFRELLGVE